MRFLNSDPAMDGLNWYAYAGGNPINFADPTGYGAQKVLGAMNSNTTSLGFAPKQPVSFTVVTVIRPPDAQAGEKSKHSVTVNPNTGRVSQEFKSTGHTDLFGVSFPARRDNMQASSALSGDNITVRMTGEVASWFMPVNINYDFSIVHDPSTGKTSINGSHDGYPSFEIYQDDRKLYDRRQGSLWNLVGSDDVKLN
jgi:hypothetical protein